MMTSSGLHPACPRLGAAVAFLIAVGGFACTGADVRPTPATGGGSGGAGPRQPTEPADGGLDAGGGSPPTGVGADAGMDAASSDPAATLDSATVDLGSTARAVLPLCSPQGGTEIRLAIRVAGGGPAPPGTGMLAENGWRFLMVDAGCHAWLLPSDNDELLQLTLSAAQQASLEGALKLGAWAGIVVPSGGCSDAPDVSFRLDQQSLTGSACGAPAGSAWSDLIAAFDAQLAALGAAATPVAGDVRYLLVADDGSNLDNRPPARWPLAIPAATVAISTQSSFQYRPGGSQPATASDAAALRAIRTTSKNGTLPGAGGTILDFTSIIDSQGTRYRLYIRDEVPFAGPDGLFRTDLF